MLLTLFKGKPAYETAKKDVDMLDRVIKLYQKSQRNASNGEARFIQELIDQTQIEREYKNQAFLKKLAEAIFKTLANNGGSAGAREGAYFSCVMSYLSQYKESNHISLDRLKQVLLGYLYADVMADKSECRSVYFKDFSDKDLCRHVFDCHGYYYDNPEAYLESYQGEMDAVIQNEFQALLQEGVFEACCNITNTGSPYIVSSPLFMKLEATFGQEVSSQFSVLPRLLNILGIGRALVDGSFKPNLPSMDFGPLYPDFRNLGGELQRDLPAILFR